MKWFRCLIHGKNFPGKLIGRDHPIGFYTTRYVKAESQESAELLALEELRKDSQLKIADAQKENSKSAMVFFEELEEVKRPNQSSGFIWYVEDENLPDGSLEIREVGQ